MSQTANQAIDGAIALIKMAANPEQFAERIKTLEEATRKCQDAVAQAGLVGDVHKALAEAQAKARELDREKAAFEQTRTNMLREAQQQADMILGNARTEAGALVESARNEAAQAKAALQQSEARMAEALQIQSEAKRIQSEALAAREDYLARVNRMEAALKAG